MAELTRELRPLTRPTALGTADVRRGAPVLPGPILLALSNFGISRGAVAMALELACAHRVGVELLSVAESQQGASVHERWRADEREARRSRSLRRLSDAAAASGIPCALTVERGDPVWVIVERASAVGASLIVLGARQGTTDTSGFPDHVLARLRRRTAVPVMSVMPAAATLPAIAVAAVDFTYSSLHAARAAAAVLRAGGMLYLAHVAPDFTTATSRAAGLDFRYGRAAAASFGALARQLVVPEDLRVECVLLEGAAVRALTQFTEDVGAEMIAVGTTAGQLLGERSFTHLGSSLLRRRRQTILSAPASPPERRGLLQEA